MDTQYTLSHLDALLQLCGYENIMCIINQSPTNENFKSVSIRLLLVKLKCKNAFGLRIYYIKIRRVYKKVRAICV